MPAGHSESWQDPPLALSLAAGDLHVWRIFMDEWLPRLETLRAALSPEETARAGRFMFAADQAGFIVARAALRHVLGRYLGRTPGEVSIETGERGKPFVSNHINSNGFTFNLSHSHGLCLIAVGRGRLVGVDVERVRADVRPLELAARFFAPEETRALEELPEEARTVGFFRCWTRKEAYVKARGEGLQIPLDQFSVTIDPERPFVLTSEDADRWWIASLAPGPGYAGAVVMERPVGSVSLWNLM